MRHPEVPETLEGWTILHQMLRLRRAAWNAVPFADRQTMGREAAEHLSGLETADAPSAAFSLLGHKGDLMLLHFRSSFDDLNAAELGLAGLRLWDYIEETTSYLSIIELGLYGDTISTRASLEENQIEPGSNEWIEGMEAMRAEKTEAMKPRLYPEIPGRRYLCFYPMDRRRGETKNWYTVPMAERGRMMRDHGMIGRSYAGKVKQIISGSIGYDDWEWGVDLFAEDPVIFKKLIYEMRFDEASADYGLFGSFYLGLRFAASDLPAWLEGTLPAWR